MLAWRDPSCALQARLQGVKVVTIETVTSGLDIFLRRVTSKSSLGPHDEVGQECGRWTCTTSVSTRGASPW